MNVGIQIVWHSDGKVKTFFFYSQIFAALFSFVCPKKKK